MPRQGQQSDLKLGLKITGITLIGIFALCCFGSLITSTLTPNDDQIHKPTPIPSTKSHNPRDYQNISASNKNANISNKNRAKQSPTPPPTPYNKQYPLAVQPETRRGKYGPRQSRLIRGPRGGCYYINSRGNKTYVDRNLCN